jgi:hypothetical protein
MARPFVEIDTDELFTMAKEGCPVAVCAQELKISDQTIYNRYYDIWKAGQAAGERMLHKRQFERAIEGDVGMLKHLGENRLGQSQKMQQLNSKQEIEVVIRKPLKADNGEIGDSRPATSPDRLLEQSGEA